MQTLHIHTRTQTNCLHFFLITQTARIAFMIVAVPSCPWREPTGTHWQPWRFWNGRQGCLPLHGPYDQNQPPEPRRSPETFSHSIRHIFSIHTLEKKHIFSIHTLEKKHGAKIFRIYLLHVITTSGCHSDSPSLHVTHTVYQKNFVLIIKSIYFFMCAPQSDNDSPTAKSACHTT